MATIEPIRSAQGERSDHSTMAEAERSQTRLGERRYLQALLYPTFVLRDGCLLLEAHCSDGNFEQNWRALAAVDPAAVEQRVNHVHLAPFEVDPEAQRRLGMRIRRAWHTALERQHPTLRCELRLYLWRHESDAEWVLDLQQMR